VHECRQLQQHRDRSLELRLQAGGCCTGGIRVANRAQDTGHCDASSKHQSFQRKRDRSAGPGQTTLTHGCLIDSRDKRRDAGQVSPGGLEDVD
jgi:hypothetical protein